MSLLINTTKDIIPLLCHKWRISLKTDSTVKQLLPAESISSINFNTDGIVIINKLSVVNGLWNYDISTQILTIKIKDTNGKYRILDITDQELVF